MKQEEKNLLIGVLAALLPYEIKVQVCNITDYTPVLKGIIGDEIFVQFDYARPIKNGDSTYNIIKDKVKPYLRPMSSMTDEERLDLSKLTNDRFKFYLYTNMPQILCCGGSQYNYLDGLSIIDWLNEHHFDYHGLIEKGLALEAPEGMYNFKNN